MRPTTPSPRTTLIFALSAALCGGGVAAAMGTAPASQPAAAQKSDAAEVDALIHQLGNRDWHAREQAQGKLSDLGDAIEPRLREALAGRLDGQTLIGVQTVLTQIDASRRLGPTLVTVHVDSIPPRQVFADLSRQAGIGIAPVLGEGAWDKRDWPAITLDVTARPFWDAVRRTCVQAGLRPLFSGGDDEPGKIVLASDVAREMDRPAAFHSSFMVVATSAARRMRFTAGVVPIHASEIELQFTFFADPKWRIVEHPETVNISLITDANGNPLTRPDPMRMQAFKRESPIWLMRTVVPKVPGGVDKLAKVRGNFQITLLEQSPAVEFDDLTARSVVKKVGRQAVHLHEVARQGNTYQVRLTVSRNGLSEQEWRQAREAEGILLQDQQGKALTRRSFEAREEGEQVSYDLTYQATGADSPGAAAKLVCTLPLEPREVTVPFELEDVPVDP